MRSLRTQITGITVGAILVTLLAATLSWSLTMGQEASSNSTEKLHLLSENARSILDSYLTGIEESVQMTSKIATDTLDGLELVECGVNASPELRSIEQTQRLDAYLREHMTFMQDTFGVVGSRTSGVASYYYYIMPDISTAEHGFLFSRRGKVGFEQLDSIDTSAIDPNDWRHNIWYYTAVNYGFPRWVGPYRSTVLDDALVVSYVMPVYRAGICLGIMGMDIPLDTLIEQINSLSVYSSGYACLVGERGSIIYHPNPQPNMFADISFAQQSSGNDALYYRRGGERWQMSYSTLCNGMKLVVTAPELEVTASWRRLLLSLPIVALAILSLFVPLTLFITEAVTEPLQQLTAAAHRLAAGDYDVELDYQGGGEVGKLTDAFRRLREHLQVYTSNLEGEAFSDTLTGIHNAEAYYMYAAQIDDTIGHSTDPDDVQFALAVYDCLGLDVLAQDYGNTLADTSIQTTCNLICQVYSRTAAFRIAENRFVVFLQGRNYANREELLCDFDIWADDTNSRASEPWLQIRVARGMATYHSDRDQDVATVLERALQHMESA